jgi:choline dehydrogenase
VKAHREVVLSAGAIQSPQLLLLSGIGAGAQLAPMNIPVLHDLPGVGRNLHDHLASPVHMQMDHSASYGVSLRAMPRNLWNIAEYLLRRSGPFANNIFESAAFVKSNPGLDRPDIQLVFQPAKRPKPSFPYPLGHGFAISPVGLYPRSRGSVSLASPDPFAAPIIDPNLLSAPEDLAPLIYGIRLARKVFASPAFAKYQATETAPGAAAINDAELEDYIRAQAYTVHHPVSTCRMGVGDGAVVDPQLRVIGIEGLRVADASVFPSITGGNTNAAIVMIAEKASDMILGRPPLPPAELPGV